MTTVADVIARCRRKLRGSRREPFRVLEQDMDSSQTHLFLTNPPGPIAADDYLCVESELLYVTSTDTATNRVNVIRGVDGTVAVAHTAGVTVEINWRIFSADILNLVVDELQSWPNAIFAVATAPEVTIGAGSERSAMLTLERFEFPLRLRRKVHGKPWVDVPAGRFRVETNLPTADFSTGNALIVATVPDAASVATRYRLEYAQAFDLSAVSTLTTDLETDAGISRHLHDALFYGVMFRAMADDEAERSDTTSQPEPREADEVAAGDRITTASAYKGLRDVRLQEEERRLRTLYPIRIA